MKFIFQPNNLKLLYNFFLFLALINIFFSTGKSFAKTFSVEKEIFSKARNKKKLYKFDCLIILIINFIKHINE